MIPRLAAGKSGQAGLAVLLAAALLADAGVARAAGKTITLLGVSGQGGSEIGARLEGRLGDRYSVVDGGVYRSEAKTIKKTGASPEEVSAVTWRLKIDVVIAGAVRDEGSRHILRVVVRQGGDGEVVGKIEGTLGRNYELTPAAEDRLVAALDKLIATAVGAPRDTPRAADLEGSDDDMPAPRAPARQREASIPDDDEHPLGTPRRRAVEPEPPPADDDAPPARAPRRAAVEPAAEEDAPDPRVRRKAPPPMPSFRSAEAVAFDVGLGLMARSLSFALSGPSAYQGSVVPAVKVDAALFPFAWSAELSKAHPVLSCFGAAINVVVATPFQSSNANLELIGGSAHRWDAALAARIPLRAAGDFALRLSGGYSSLAYASDDSVHLGVPNVDYKVLRQSVGVTIPLWTPRLTVDATGAIFTVLDPGEIGAITQYGAGSGWGGDLDFGLTVRPTKWLYLRGQFHFAAVNMTYHGAGARVGSGSHDQFIDGGLVIGYAIR